MRLVGPIGAIAYAAIISTAIMPSDALAVRGVNSEADRDEFPYCVQRLRSVTDSNERIEVQTDDGARLTGRFEGVNSGMLRLGNPEPDSPDAVPLEAITGVAYWRRELVQPDWIIAGLASGFMAGALIGAVAENDDDYCDSFICGAGWMRGAAIGVPIGLGLGIVASVAVPKKHVIRCVEAD